MKHLLTIIIVTLILVGAQADNGPPQVRQDSDSQWNWEDQRWPVAEEVKMIRKAAEQGDAQAQFRLALMYDRGHGVPQNHTKVVKWLRKAAEQDFVEAQYNLCCMYDSGQGVPQDHAEAVVWFHKAAERGYASAQKNLGGKYGQGQGVPLNHAEAFVWSSIAAMSGHEGAINNRNLAASKLLPEDLDAAQKRAAKLYEEIRQNKTEQ